MHNNEDKIAEFSSKDYHLDKYGNRVAKRCPKCGGKTIPLRDVTGAIYAGQCLNCHAALANNC